MNIKCYHCSALNPTDSKFCHKCGTNLNNNDNRTSSDHKKNDNHDKKKSFWSVFADMHDSSGDERQGYLAMTSDSIWELLTRIATNTFENFIADNKDTLNKQPYKVIEGLKNAFLLCTTGGYWLWLAEYSYKTNKLAPLKDPPIDDIKKRWEKLTTEGYSKIYEDTDDEIKKAMETLLVVRVDGFMENYPDAKEIPNETVEKLKTTLILNIMGGYIGGIAESNFRK